MKACASPSTQAQLTKARGSEARTSNLVREACVPTACCGAVLKYYSVAAEIADLSGELSQIMTRLQLNIESETLETVKAGLARENCKRQLLEELGGAKAVMKNPEKLKKFEGVNLLHSGQQERLVDRPG